MQTSQFVSEKGLPSPSIPILNSLAQTDSNSVKSENPVHKPADPGSMKEAVGLSQYKKQDRPASLSGNDRSCWILSLLSSSCTHKEDFLSAQWMRMHFSERKSSLIPQGK